MATTPAATKSFVQKLGITPTMRSILVDAPGDLRDELSSALEKVQDHLRGGFDYIHLFITTQAAMHRQFEKLKRHLKPGGKLWVSWPKGGKNGTDLSITEVIAIGYDYGLVESKTISLDDTWSAIKFTHPLTGKEYRNSYGKLKV